MEQSRLDEGGMEAGNNVVSFAEARDNALRKHQPPASDEELAEYRAMLPILRQMIREREVLIGAQGCPVMRGIFGIADD